MPKPVLEHRLDKRTGGTSYKLTLSGLSRNKFFLLDRSDLVELRTLINLALKANTDDTTA